MIVANNSNMVAEAVEILCEQTICSVQFNISVPKSDPAADSASVSIDLVSLSDSAVSCALVESSSTKFNPSIRSGSHTDIGPRKSNEDEHICIDDLSNTLGPLYQWPLPSSFYAVFDGHGGSEAASYLKEHAMKLFFLDSDLPQTSDIDDIFLQELEDSRCKAFLLADKALANECSISDYCGSTALTALILGKHLLIANAGDCRAVLCRNGIAVQMSQDHRPGYLEEKIRVESLGGFIEGDYLNGELAVTRALGDWYMKSPIGFESSSPLTARPDVSQTVLTEDDEFLIIGCDGIWDVMSNQEAVGVVRRELRRYDDPNWCARELVNQALLRESDDNLTAIVVCFSSSGSEKTRQRPRFRCSSLTEEARDRLRNLLEGN
ncbi:probable protein phosphatase 2C 49 [Rutidosis leptorrhynchoides]|uniref:probable protein phosphatase 2C 49 n=1 Tax=Rutidosis leptorrhynchoides TaxID=125765 RepID=UPI003A99FCC1